MFVRDNERIESKKQGKLQGLIETKVSTKSFSDFTKLVCKGKGDMEVIQSEKQ